MAIEKEVKDDEFRVAGEFKYLNVRQATIIKEDGEELSRSFHRRVLSPDDDISNESQEIQEIAGAVWSDEVKEKYAEHKRKDIERAAEMGG